MLLFSYSNLFAQNTIKYSELETNKRPKGKFASYEARDGSIYKVGDVLIIGVPSSNKTFGFITEGDGLLTPFVRASINVSGNEAEIRSIAVGGNRRVGFFVVVRCKGLTGLGDGLSIELEKAISSGEVESFGMTSDQALAELKKAKDKLDLGLITEEQYEKIKAELVKHIN